MLAAVLAVVAVSGLLAVNIFPFVTNDSVVYLDHSRNLTNQGLVIHGFRQIGYPLGLALVRTLSNAVGAEPLVAMALLQRILLLASGALAAVYWRWWSLPFLVFVVTSGNVIYTNFILTEGLGLPLACLLVFPFVSYLRVVREVDQPQRQTVVLLGLLVVLGALALFLLRFTYVVFGLAPLALVVGTWRTEYRKLSLGLFGLFVVLAGLFAFGASLENNHEAGVASPTAGGNPTRWYYAWQQVFTLIPENRLVPDLAEFYDEGDVRTFQREVAARNLPVEEETALYDSEISSMVDMAGLTIADLKLRSTVWALIGGRLHDIGGAVTAAVSSTRFDVDEFINFNQFARVNGPQMFADEYNDGQIPGAVITDPVGVLPPIRNGQMAARILLPVALAVLLVGLFNQRTRILSATGLGVTIILAIGTGSIMADNYRFLIATVGFTLLTATGSATATLGSDQN